MASGPPRFSFRPLQWRDVGSIARWHYDGQYAFYDLSLLVLMGVAAVQGLLRAIGVTVYFVAYLEHDDSAQLAGVFSFTSRNRAVEIGLGLRPDLTGQGLGLAFVTAGLDYARANFRPRSFRLVVAEFNVRAIRVYERAGFHVVRQFTDHHRGRPYSALLMERDA